MQAWGTAEWVSVLALVASALSFLAALFAAVVSHRSLSHARRVHEEDRRIAFERERSQLLEVINTGRALLDKTRIKIGVLKANFDASPEAVKAQLTGYTNLFTEYYPRIEAGVRQGSMLWDEVAGWNQDHGVEALVKHQAKFRALLHEDQVAHDAGIYAVTIFESKLAEATKRLSSNAFGGT